MTTAMQSTDAEKWHCYFTAAKGSNLLAVFDSLVSLGMRPVPIGEDGNGAIKIPIGTDWGLTDNKSRRKLLARHVKQQIPVGIGVQADGHVVLDIDPPNKDRGRLAEAWKEAAALLLGGEDWPDTLTVKTKAGCHVWFRVSQQVRDAWQDHGKLKMPLPCGGAVEFFTGNSKQMQVATAPSEGKAIAREIIPADLPASLESAIIDLLNPEPETKPVATPSDTPASSDDEAWFMDRLEKLTIKTLNAEAGNRHDTYRAAVRTIAGYAKGMNLEDKQEVVYNHLAGAHKDAKPEVSDYVLLATFKWAWKKGAEKELYRPRPSVKEEEASEFLGEAELLRAANVGTIKAMMQNREWLWGDPVKNTGWFLNRGLHLVEGKEGTGKTRWLLDLARRWSYDLRWPDGSPITVDTDSKMLFVASDSHFDQIAMTSEAFGIPDDNIIFAGPDTHPYDFTTLDDPETLNLIRLWCDKYKVKLIVIDTLMAATIRPLVDPQEVAQIAGPLRQIAREKNVVIVLVGHLNSQGETWGRAMGRQCDNVIRMEADPSDEKRITIKSVKARWNRFELPVIHGTQGESGWEYSTPGSDAGESALKTAAGRATDSVVAYLRQYGSTQPTLKTLVEVLSESGHAESTVYRVVKEMVVDGVICKLSRETYTGKTIEYYDLP